MVACYRANSVPLNSSKRKCFLHNLSPLRRAACASAAWVCANLRNRTLNSACQWMKIWNSGHDVTRCEWMDNRLFMVLDMRGTFFPTKNCIFVNRVSFCVQPNKKSSSHLPLLLAQKTCTQGCWLTTGVHIARDWYSMTSSYRLVV